jgi:hypothetical protein
VTSDTQTLSPGPEPRRPGPEGVRPVLFLDVDGVISLFGFDDRARPPGRYHWVNGVLHCISFGAAERIRRAGERLELVWATGWEETANEYLPHLLALPAELPFLTFDRPAQFGSAHWKVDAIDRYVGPRRPAAWIDDCHDPDCKTWASSRAAPTLLITTRPDEGILDRHVDELLAWADGLGGADQLSGREGV